MKTVFISILMAILPLTSQTNEVVYFEGNALVHPGETASLAVYPENVSYIYEWNSDPEFEKAQNVFDIDIQRNKISMTPRAGLNTGVSNVFCSVYDEYGNLIGETSTCVMIY